MRVQKELVIYDNDKTYHITLSREIPRKWPKIVLNAATFAAIAVFMLGAAAVDSDSLLPFLLVMTSGTFLGFRGILESARAHAEETNQP